MELVEKVEPYELEVLDTLEKLERWKARAYDRINRRRHGTLYGWSRINDITYDAYKRSIEGYYKWCLSKL